MSISQKPLIQCTNRAQLADLLGIEVWKLNYFASEQGRKYKSFEIPKKSGGTRQIYAPDGALVTIQRRLASLLADIYSDVQPSYAHGFIKGESILNNATHHLNKRLVLNLDLSNFFPSITAGRVIALFRAKPFYFNDNVVSAIAGLTCYRGSLPQGAPTSPVISNMICLRMDRALFELARDAGARYSRYADDITFSTGKKIFPRAILEKNAPDETLQLGLELRRIISDNYFDINEGKTRLAYGAKSKYVTGVKVNMHPNLSRTYVRKLRTMLHAWEVHGLTNAQKDFVALYGGGSKSYAKVVGGRLAHLKNIKGDTDLVYRRLFNRFVRLEGKGRPELPLTEIEELYQRTYVIESAGKHGTGFILDNSWLITCDHVVNGDNAEYFLFSDFLPLLHKRTRADPNWRSPIGKYDLIALPITEEESKKSKLSLKSAPLDVVVEVDMNCKVVGFPAYQPGARPSVMRIGVTKIELDKYGIKNAYVDKKMISGSSGSPVLNEKNEVVGLVRTGTKNLSSGDDSIGYTFLPIQEIRKCLAQFKSNTQEELVTVLALSARVGSDV